jgi:hypothetical protein
MEGSSEGLQRFAVILDNATSLVHECFFRRPTRKIMILLQVCHPKEQAARINLFATRCTRKITVSLKRVPQEVGLSHQPHCNLLLPKSRRKGGTHTPFSALQ